MLTEQFDTETPPDYVAANERLYKALGLIPADADLRDLTLDLLSGGVVGFYRDDQGTLYVVSKTGLPGVNERITFAHEYDHALQDQNFTVFKDQDGILDQTDRILARQAVYEGDATLLMTLWAAAHFGPADLAELLALSADPEAAGRSSSGCRRSSARRSSSRTRPGSSFVQAAQLQRRLARRSTTSTTGCPSRPSRSSTRRSTRANEAPDHGRPARRSRRPARHRLDRAARGHVRRAPARDLAARGRASTPATARRGDGRLGRRPARRRRGARRRLGRRHRDRPGTRAADATEFARRRPAGDRRPGQPGADLGAGRHARSRSWSPRRGRRCSRST